MKRISALLISTSFLMFPVAHDMAWAKTFRSHHGVAFERGGNNDDRYQNIETASGDEAQKATTPEDLSPVHDIVAPKTEPKHVEHSEHMADALPVVAENPASAEPAENTADAKPLAVPSLNCAVAQDKQKGTLYSFYHTAEAVIERAASDIKMTLDGGAASYDGKVYLLKTAEIMPSVGEVTSPFAMVLVHEANDKSGDRLVVKVPVMSGDSSNPNFQMILQSGGRALVPFGGLVPKTHGYTLISKACHGAPDILVFDEPTMLSALQIEQFKSGK